MILHHTYSQKFRKENNLDKSLKKEVIFYSIIVVILLIISILNNVFWKIGKEEKEPMTNTQESQQTQQLEINNITYNVPFEEEWLD